MVALSDEIEQLVRSNEALRLQRKADAAHTTLPAAPATVVVDQPVSGSRRSRVFSDPGILSPIRTGPAEREEAEGLERTLERKEAELRDQQAKMQVRGCAVLS